MTHCPDLLLACPLGQLPREGNASTSLDASFPRPCVHLGHTRLVFQSLDSSLDSATRVQEGTPTLGLHRWTCPTPTFYLQVAARKGCCPNSRIIQYAPSGAADNRDLPGSLKPPSRMFAGRMKRLRSKVQPAQGHAAGQRLAGQEPKAT